MLWRNRYLLSPDVTPEHFTAAALHADLEADLSVAQLRSRHAGGTHDPGRSDRRNAASAGRSQHAGAHPETFDGVWMSPDHTQALLMVQTLAAGFDLNGQEQAIGRIEAAFATARKASPRQSRRDCSKAGRRCSRCKPGPA